MTKENEIVLIAKSLLANDIGLIEASRKLVRLQYEANLENEEDLKIFWIIDSETDHLPIGQQRANVSAQKLIESDKEIGECEEFYRDTVRIACINIISNFGN